MKKLYLFLFILLTGFSVKTQAGNLLGVQMNYTVVAPGVYTVDFGYVQDCSSVPPPSFLYLDLLSPGCNAPGRRVTLNKVSVYQMVTQTCANGLTANCSPDNQSGNAFVVRYTATLFFTAAEQACQDWTMSVTVGTDTRAASANLVGTPPLHLEAYVNLRSGINSSSPQYSPMSSPYVLALYNQSTTFSLDAADPDGDSLAYSFRTALQGTGSAVLYQAPSTAQLPIPSSPAITVNSNGEISLKPTVYVPNSSPTQGANRYVTVVQIDEYRKVNGVVTLVGSTQREMVLDVRLPDPTLNNIPKLENFAVNGQLFSPLTPLVLTVGQPVTVTFDATDLDPLDQLKLAMDTSFFASIGLASFRILNPLSRPQIQIRFTPTVNHLQPYLYHLPITLQDDSCPLKGLTNQVLEFDVRNALGTNPELVTNAHFKAFPNPFTDELYFQFSAETNPETILIYNLVGQAIDQILIAKATSKNGKITWKNADKYPAGTYVAKLVSGTKAVQNIKFMKL